MILSIQYLRAFAAIMVVAFHIAGKLPLSHRASLLATVGAAGVDIFFVISGFVMYLTTKDRAIRPAAFVAKRLIRIVPLYYLVTTFAILIILIWPKAASNARLSLEHAVASYAFIAFPSPAAPTRLWPLVVQGWTLNYEVYFYTLVGFSLFLAQSWRLAALSTVIIGIVMAGLVTAPSGILRFYVSPLLLEFLGGYWLAHFYHRRAELPFNLLLALFGASLLSLVALGRVGDVSDWERILFWGMPCFGLVASTVLLGRRSPSRPVKSWIILGDASYAIYLIQFIAVSAFDTIWHRMRLSNEQIIPQIIFIVVGMASVVILGVILHFLVELPISRQLKSRLEAKRTHLNVSETAVT